MLGSDTGYQTKNINFDAIPPQPVHFKEIKPGSEKPIRPNRTRRVKSESRPPNPSKTRKVRFEEDNGPPTIDLEEDYGDESGIYDTLPNIEADSKQKKKKKGRSWSFR